MPENWQLSISVGECGSLLLGGNCSFDDNQCLTISEHPVSILESVKDLGVFVDSRLEFSKHIDSIIAKAKQRTYLLFKSFKSHDIKLMVFAFKVYVTVIRILFTYMVTSQTS